jgi:hypothetical protein
MLPGRSNKSPMVNGARDEGALLNKEYLKQLEDIESMPTDEQGKN